MGPMRKTSMVELKGVISMSKYYCPVCGLVHTDGTKTLMRHAKKDKELRLFMLLRKHLPVGFEPWQFYFMLWEKVG